MKTNEEIAKHVLAHDGVLAVRVERCGPVSEYGTVHKPGAPAGVHNLLEGAMQIFELFQYKEPFRIVAGDAGMTISCFCDYGIAVATIAPTSHRIHKSLRRMTLRAIKPTRSEILAIAAKAGAA